MSGDLAHFEVGMFVESSANNLGTGKLVAKSGTNGTVEYFEAPDDTGLREEQLPLATLKRVQLEAHTRVFVKNEGLTSWSIATLVWHIDSNVRVILPGPHEENLPVLHIYVRCNRPICDPTLLLASRIVESTTYAQARRGFLTLMSQQKLAAGGMHCLLSSAIDLEHHQVEVVRRVLRDPIQRYLLGDEVGLGKTIEAGLLIRQHIHDYPLQHQVLVIVPKGLKHQWKYELKGRFGLHSELHKTVSIFDVTQLEQLAPDFHPSMVVRRSATLPNNTSPA
jgi:ATP-dependent helicase HepA